MLFDKDDIYKLFESESNNKHYVGKAQITRDIRGLMRTIRHQVNEVYNVCYLHSHHGGVNFSHEDACLNIHLVDAYSSARDIFVHWSAQDEPLYKKKFQDDHPYCKAAWAAVDILGRDEVTGGYSLAYQTHRRLDKALRDVGFTPNQLVHEIPDKDDTMVTLWKGFKNNAHVTVAMALHTR